MKTIAELIYEMYVKIKGKDLYIGDEHLLELEEKYVKNLKGKLFNQYFNINSSYVELIREREIRLLEFILELLYVD